MDNLVVLADGQAAPANTSEPPRRPKWSDTLQYIANPEKFCRDNLAEYGPIFKTSVFGGTTVFVGSAPANKMAFNGDNSYTKIGLPATTMEMFGEHSLFQRPDLHRDRKSALRPGFTGRMLANYMPHMDQVLNEHLQTWQTEQPVSLMKMIEEVSFDLLAPLLLGIRLDQGDSALAGLPIATKAELKQQYKTFFDGFYGLVKWNSPLTTFGRGKRARAKLMAFMEAVIAQRRQSGLAATPDFLSMMLMAQQDNPEGVFNDELVANQCLLQLWASYYEVSGLLASWMYQLGEQPEVIKQLRTEQAQVLGDDPTATLPTMEQLKQLTFLEATIKETLRILPPSSTATRTLTKSVLLDDMLFKHGWNIIAEPRIAHAIPEHFSNPNAYNPKRFLPEQGEGRAYEFIPFGGGVHACLGAQMAMVSNKLFAIHLLHKLDWQLLGKADFVQFPLRKIKGNYQIQLRSKSQVPAS